MHTLPYLGIEYPHGVVQIEEFLEGVCNSSNLVPGKGASASWLRNGHCVASVYERFEDEQNILAGLQQSKKLATSSSVVNVLCRRLVWTMENTMPQQSHPDLPLESFPDL